jgi:putative SOS response-associated peptidase YedK
MLEQVAEAAHRGLVGALSFRSLLTWRWLVPVDNFYKKTAAGKQPYAIALADQRLMALAGLWESWRSPAGERVRSFTIVTTTPNELCAELHNRMPVVLKPPACRRGLAKIQPTCRSSRRGWPPTLPMK